MTSFALALQLLAITHVTLIDPDAATPLRDVTIVVRGTRVAAVGSSGSTRIPARAREIDGHGKFVIPGLWDMHVHVQTPGGRALIPLFVANGRLYDAAARQALFDTARRAARRSVVRRAPPAPR